MSDLPIELLRQLLRYEPETGKLFWIERPVSMFKDGRLSADHAARAWNAKHAGKEAFTAIQAPGYKQGRIFRKKHFGHRVAWALTYGEWPHFEIDHENHDGTDNRLSNMAPATHGQNSRNLSLPRDNTSGRIGVYWCKTSENWYARITFEQVVHHLGTFPTFEAACGARAAAERKFGFHKNHGAERAKAA